MNLVPPHAWAISPTEAVAVQRELAGAVLREGAPILAGRIAGVDVGFEDGGKITRAAVVVLDMPARVVVEMALARIPTTFPYVPGLLAFRELPAVVEALKQLREPPDLLMCDGQGIAHPRRLGIAAHLGVIAGLPSSLSDLRRSGCKSRGPVHISPLFWAIVCAMARQNRQNLSSAGDFFASAAQARQAASVGVGKTRLCGRHEDVPNVRGAWVPLEDRGEVIGAVLRTRAGVKPVYVSIGHRLSLDAAVASVMAALGRYRLPAPIRAAHRLASRASRIELGMLVE